MSLRRRGFAAIACTFTNDRLPTVTVTKISNGGVGPSRSMATNGFGAAQTITTVTRGVGLPEQPGPWLRHRPSRPSPKPSRRAMCWRRRPVRAWAAAARRHRTSQPARWYSMRRPPPPVPLSPVPSPIPGFHDHADQDQQWRGWWLHLQWRQWLWRGPDDHHGDQWCGGCGSNPHPRCGIDHHHDHRNDSCGLCAGVGDLLGHGRRRHGDTEPRNRCAGP